MSPLRHRRLAPLGPAPAIPTDDGLDAGDSAELLGSLADTVRSACSSVTTSRRATWDDLRRAFPRPDHATAAAGLAVASFTLASLGIIAVVTIGDPPTAETATAGTALVSGTMATGPVGEPDSDLDLADLAVTDVPVAVVPVPPPIDPVPATGPQAAGPEATGSEATGSEATGTAEAGTAATEATEGQVALAPVAPAPVPATPTGPVRAAAPVAPRGQSLSRISPSRPAPPTAPVAPELALDAPVVPGLSRLSRSQVLAITPFPSLPSADAHGVVPVDAGALPLGKGMWLYVPEEIEGGSVDALVARAQQVGLTHVYVRTGSSKGGFYAQGYMDELLPKAHAVGIRVYGWDFPYLDDVDADVARAVAAITHTTPGGERIDGFAADIETASEGTNLSAEGAGAYGQRLREAVGPAYPLVAVVPRPSIPMQARYPYAAVIPHFDAVAPMTYWLNRQPDSDVVNDVAFLAPFGKPVLPIGQAYDGSPEGGRPGPPPAEEIQRFLGAAQQVGAAGVSFWSWQHASQSIWDTLQAAPEFRWEAKPPGEMRSDQVRALQVQLNRLGFPVPASGTWDELTTGSLRSYQERAHLPRTGILDAATLAVLMRPFNPPIQGLPRADGVDLGLVHLADLPLDQAAR